MVGLSYVRQHKALRHVGQPHRPAAGHSEGGPDRPLSPQVAAPHQEPWAFKEPEDLIQRCNEIWKGPDHERGRRSRGRSEAALSFPRGLPLPLSVPRERVRRRQSLATAAGQPRDCPEAAAMIACVFTTPA
jgi:hypothetical protein